MNDFSFNSLHALLTMTKRPEYYYKTIILLSFSTWEKEYDHRWNLKTLKMDPFTSFSEIEKFAKVYGCLVILEQGVYWRWEIKFICQGIRKLKSLNYF